MMVLIQKRTNTSTLKSTMIIFYEFPRILEIFSLKLILFTFILSLYWMYTHLNCAAAVVFVVVIGMWVGLFCHLFVVVHSLRGWSWWHTTMHFQSQWYYETWQNKNQLWHYSNHYICTHTYTKQQNIEWAWYRILFYVCCCWYRLVIRNFI